MLYGLKLYFCTNIIMLTEREKRFMEYWKQNRDKEKKVFRQLLFGLPLGLIFVIPIILNFASGWYKRADMWARAHNDDNTGVVLIVAALIILVFIAVFSKRHRWEMNEQTYRELELKDMRENEELDAANNH
jgi:membrane protein YdbS with pleckstrin-like domain